MEIGQKSLFEALCEQEAQKHLLSILMCTEERGLQWSCFVAFEHTELHSLVLSQTLWRCIPLQLGEEGKGVIPILWTRRWGSGASEGRTL